MLNQIGFQLKRYRGGRLITLGVMIALHIILLIILAPRLLDNATGARSILGVVISGCLLPVFVIPPLIDFFREFYRLYAKNSGMMTFLTPAKGFDIVFSRVLVLGCSFFLGLALGIVPLMFYLQGTADAVIASGWAEQLSIAAWVPELVPQFMEIFADGLSFFGVLSLVFFAGACYRSVFAPLSGRFVLAILVFVVGSYVLSFVDVLAFLPEPWRISWYGSVISIEASGSSLLTTGLYMLIQVAKTLLLCYGAGRLLDKYLDISA